MPGLLGHADQDDRAALYDALGVMATYDPATRSAELAVTIPRGARNVSEDRYARHLHDKQRWLIGWMRGSEEAVGRDPGLGR